MLARKWLYIIAIAFLPQSCAMVGHGAAFGGGFGQGAAESPVLIHGPLQAQSPEEGRIKENKQILGLPERASRLRNAEDKSRLAYKNGKLKLYQSSSLPVIDSLPDSARNGADKRLKLAARRIRGYQQMKENMGISITTYCVLAGLPSLVGIVFLAVHFEPNNILLNFLVFVSVVSILALFVVGYFAVKVSPFLKLSQAIYTIKTAPKYAPPNRRIEYEVRCLLMTYKYTSKWGIAQKLMKIRNLGQTDPYNPWLKKLDEFEKNTLKSAKTHSRAFVNLLCSALIAYWFYLLYLVLGLAGSW